MTSRSAADFTIKVDDQGVAHVVLGQPDRMPALGVGGAREIARLCAELGAQSAVRSIFVCSRGWDSCAGGTPELVDSMLSDEASRPRVMRWISTVTQ